MVYITISHYHINSNTHLSKTLEEDEDIEAETYNKHWGDYRRHDAKNINELETDVKTPDSNYSLSTKEKLIINAKPDISSKTLITDQERRFRYNGNKVYKDITSYCCDYYDKYFLKEFLFHPLIQGKTLYCNIKLVQNINDNNNKDGDTKKRNNCFYQAAIQSNDFPLMTIQNVTTNSLQALKYYVYANNNELIGKIKANFLSTSFAFFKKKHKLNYHQGDVHYKFNPLGLFGLRKMEISLNKPGNNSDHYTNKKAIWIRGMLIIIIPSIDYKQYRLDFNSRVKQASSKNFIIENKNKEKLLQFGKIDNGSYAMDFQSPFSPFQAFCICLTSIASKVLCE